MVREPAPERPGLGRDRTPGRRAPVAIAGPAAGRHDLRRAAVRRAGGRRVRLRRAARRGILVSGAAAQRPRVPSDARRPAGPGSGPQRRADPSQVPRSASSPAIPRRRTGLPASARPAGTARDRRARRPRRPMTPQMAEDGAGRPQPGLGASGFPAAPGAGFLSARPPVGLLTPPHGTRVDSLRDPLARPAAPAASPRRDVGGDPGPDLPARTEARHAEGPRRTPVLHAEDTGRRAAGYRRGAPGSRPGRPGDHLVLAGPAHG